MVMMMVMMMMMIVVMMMTMMMLTIMRIMMLITMLASAGLSSIVEIGEAVETCLVSICPCPANITMVMMITMIL